MDKIVCILLILLLLCIMYYTFDCGCYNRVINGFSVGGVTCMPGQMCPPGTIECPKCEKPPCECPNIQCDSKIKELCGEDVRSESTCDMCIGKHQFDFRKATCDPKQINEFCRGEINPPPPPGPSPSPSPSPPSPPCPEAEKIARDRGLDKLPQCTNDQCFKVDENGNNIRVCGSDSTYTNGEGCGNCKDLPYFPNKNNICILTDNCKKNTCLTENIPAINYDPAGKLIFQNSTNASMYVVIENTNSDYKKVKNTPKMTKGMYDFYEVISNGNLTFDLNKNNGEWIAGKSFIIKNSPKNQVFNGNSLGGLEWTIKYDTDGEGNSGMIASANLSAVDGINFNSQMNIYNVICGGVNMKKTNLDFNNCPFKGNNADGIPSCKTPDIQKDFIDSTCPNAVIDECGPGWKKSDPCYYNNIKNKYPCLQKWTRNPETIEGKRKQWLEFIGENSIYAWSYDEIQILQPKTYPYSTTEPLPESAGWKSSQHYKCISDFECDEKCFGYVGNNPVSPLVSCLVPSSKKPSIVFTITDIME